MGEAGAGPMGMKRIVPELSTLTTWRAPSIMPALNLDGSIEYPAWVRQCADEFKEKKLLLTHENRAIHQTFKPTPHARQPPARTCTCHKEFQRQVPDVDLRFFPAELLAPAVGTKRARGAGVAVGGRSKIATLEMNDAEQALFGADDVGGLDGRKGEAEEGEEGEGAANAGGKEGAEGKEGGAGAGLDGDDEVEEDEEDMGADDYEEGEKCDDDEDYLVEEGGAASEDEETRYGTI